MSEMDPERFRKYSVRYRIDFIDNFFTCQRHPGFRTSLKLYTNSQSAAQYRLDSWQQSDQAGS